MQYVRQIIQVSTYNVLMLQFFLLILLKLYDYFSSQLLLAGTLSVRNVIVATFNRIIYEDYNSILWISSLFAQYYSEIVPPHCKVPETNYSNEEHGLGFPLVHNRFTWKYIIVFYDLKIMLVLDFVFEFHSFY